MKKILALVALFVSVLSGYAQTTDASSYFKFNDPGTLTPAVSFEGVSGSYVTVTEYQFTSGPITVRFNKNVPVTIERYGDGENQDIYLLISRGAEFYISCASNVELVSVNFKAGTNASETGSIGLMSKYKGTYSMNSGWKNVDANGDEIKGITQIGFNNGGKDAHMRTVQVTYRTPMNVVSVSSFSPANNSTLDQFESLDVHFTYEMAKATQDFDIKTTAGKTVGTLKAAQFNDKVVTFVPEETITTPGSYYVTFPEKSVQTADGLYAKEFTYKFSVAEPLNTFNPVSVPNESVEDAMPNEISVTFPGNIGNRTALTGKKFDVIGRNNGKVTVATASTQGYKTLVFTLQDPVTVSDIYTITVPEKTVYDANQEKYNDEFVITYKVAGADAPSDDVLQKAKTLLSYDGVGYPKKTSQEYLTLKSLVTTADKGDAAFNNAIDDYLTCTDIVLPTSGEYYHIVNVTPNGATTYLAYDGTSVYLTGSESYAYSFLATKQQDGTFTFSTLDGKYLHSLVASNNYRYTSSKNVTDALADVSSLTIAKLQSDSKKEEALGKMSIKGLIGKKYGIGNEVEAYSTVITSENAIAEGETTTYFSENISSAFILESASAPSALPVSFSLVFNPSNSQSMNALESVTLTVPNVENLTYTNKAVTVKNTATSKSYDMNVTSAGANVFVMTPKVSLADGTYKFIIPEGAFTYKKNNKEYNVQEITDNFTISNPDEFQIDFRTQYEMRVISKVGTQNFVEPEDLNDFDIVAENADGESVHMYAANKEIQLLDASLRVVTTGKLSPYTTSESQQYVVLVRDGVDRGIISVDAGTSVYYTNGQNDVVLDGDVRETRTKTITTYHLKLKLAKELNAENIPYTTTNDGRLYHYIFEEATFGDENFGKYLQNSSSVAKRDCHVNAYMNFPVYVVNPEHSGIEDVEAGTETNAKIFDLSGRRVENTSRPGIYIINGKKHIIK